MLTWEWSLRKGHSAVTGREGRVVPFAVNLLDFSLKGPGTFAGHLQRRPDCTACTQPRRNAWKGRVMAVVKSGKAPGELTLAIKRQRAGNGENKHGDGFMIGG